MRRKYPKPAELSVSQILAWADTFHKRFGKWPHARAGRIAGSPGENWRKVDNALRIGLRGLPGGTTLAGLLFEQRGRRHLFKLPRLTEEQILIWADRHRKRTGRWPKQKSGPVLDRPEETWAGISDDLRSGRRGLAGGSSLADLLFRRRGVRHHLISPRLTLEQILAWADAYHRRTGRWPSAGSGAISNSSGETWRRVDDGLRRGNRGLAKGRTLARLLAEERGARNRTNIPKLNRQAILLWATAHYARTGKRPTRNAGEIPESCGDNWHKINAALRIGLRGLPGGSSLAQLLEQNYNPRGRETRRLEEP